MPDTTDTGRKIERKLQTLRVKLLAEPLKKSGTNTFAKYSYFELGDFLPTTLRLMESLNLTSVTTFLGEFASLTLIDSDRPDDRLVFTTPMSTVDLKGCHPVQNLGAVQTYLRRYLWVMVLELVEHDAVDAAEPVKKPKKEPIQEPVAEPSEVAEPAGQLGFCKRCNAPLRMSQAGHAYCSALCWKTEPGNRIQDRIQEEISLDDLPF